MPLNPYIIGNPVGKTNTFVGREEVLNSILNIFQNSTQNSLVLFGQRRIGKTSVLQRLIDWLPQQGSYLPVHFDLQYKSDWALDQVLVELWNNITDATKQSDINFVDQDVEFSFKNEWLPKILDRLPRKHSLVLLFDEFDVIANTASSRAINSFFPYLKQLLNLYPEKMKFIFVVGRNISELSGKVLTVFRDIPAIKITLLSFEETEQLIRLSENNDGLHWTPESIGYIWELTKGHPYLTQLFCFHLWEQVYGDDNHTPDAFTITISDIDRAVDDVLAASNNILDSLWNIVPLAEKFTLSIIAKEIATPISQERIEGTLADLDLSTGISVRDLRKSPELLEEWDIIEKSDGGYKYRVELFRKWVSHNRPLQRIKDDEEISIQTRGEKQYLIEIAEHARKAGDRLNAMGYLTKLLDKYPDEFPAFERLLELAGNSSEKLKLIEKYEDINPNLVPPYLSIPVYRDMAEKALNDNEKLFYYGKIKSIAPDNQYANKGIISVWEKIGDRARQIGDLNGALNAYQIAGLKSKMVDVTDAINNRESWRLKGEILEAKGKLKSALNAYQNAGNASKVKQLSERIRDKQLQSVNEVHWWNPWQIFQLLWLVLTFSNDLEIYKQKFGNTSLNYLTSILVSSLMWFPIFLPTLLLGLKILPLNDLAWQHQTYLILSGIVLVVWIFQVNSIFSTEYLIKISFSIIMLLQIAILGGVSVGRNVLAVLFIINSMFVCISYIASDFIIIRSEPYEDVPLDFANLILANGSILIPLSFMLDIKTITIIAILLFFWLFMSLGSGENTWFGIISIILVGFSHFQILGEWFWTSPNLGINILILFFVVVVVISIGLIYKSLINQNDSIALYIGYVVILGIVLISIASFVLYFTINRISN